MQLRKLSGQRFVEVPHSVIPDLFRDLLSKAWLEVSGQRLEEQKSGPPLNGSPFSEKNCCKFQDASCKKKKEDLFLKGDEVSSLLAFNKTASSAESSSDGFFRSATSGFFLLSAQRFLCSQLGTVNLQLLF